MCSSAKSPSPEFRTAWAEQIKDQSSLAFSDYLRLALYHPQCGYYAKADREVGTGGDFYTNVSIGPVFAEIVLEQVKEMWLRLGAPAPFYLIEQGAHHGQFAADFLDLASSHSEFNTALRYAIVEPLPTLAERQRAALTGFANRTEWHPDFSTLQVENGVHWSNELVDALPFELIEWNGTRWDERRVTWTDLGLSWVSEAIADPELRAAVAELPEPPEAGYQTEIRLSQRIWLRELTGSLKRGYVLLCDYGYPRAIYYQPSRREGTLYCYEQHHRTTDPLEAPGRKDVSAHVDFTALAQDAEAAGFQLRGFTDQHHFIVGAAEARLREHEGRIHASTDQRWLKSFRTLLHPELMGTQFKFMAFSKGTEEVASLSGFRFQTDAGRILGIKS